MGRLLAGRAVMARLAPRPVLGRAATTEPERNALGADSAGSGLLPADRTGQRVEIASGVVWQERDGRSLGSDFGLAEAHKLYRCHDRLLRYKEELFHHLVNRWRDMFNASFDVLLYDLTSTYFEINAADVPEGDKRRHGYSRDKRPDCPQVVIALCGSSPPLPDPLRYSFRYAPVIG